MDADERLTQLELRYMAQQDMLESLSQEVLAERQRAEGLEKRVKRLEEALQELLLAVDTPANERPPHY
jgi:SlyX protein